MKSDHVALVLVSLLLCVLLLCMIRSWEGSLLALSIMVSPSVSCLQPWRLLGLSVSI